MIGDSGRGSWGNAKCEANRLRIFRGMKQRWQVLSSEPTSSSSFGVVGSEAAQDSGPSKQKGSKAREQN